MQYRSGSLMQTAVAAGTAYGFIVVVRVFGTVDMMRRAAGLPEGLPELGDRLLRRLDRDREAQNQITGHGNDLPESK